MKKIKFAAQIFILVASFPVLFVSGISHHKKKADQPGGIKTINVPAAKKSASKDECYCRIEFLHHNGMIQQAILKN